MSTRTCGIYFLFSGSVPVSLQAVLCAVLYCFTPFLPLPSMRVMILVLSFLSLLVTIPQGLAVLFTVLSFLKM